MKYKVYLTIFLLSLAGLQTVFSQTSFKDLFNSDTPLSYLGIDFTEVKVNGHTDYELEEMANRHFSNINNLVLNESKKYDLQKFFHKSGVQTDLSFVEAHNKKISIEKIKSNGDDKELKRTDLEKLVKGYNFGGKKGMGVLFVVETMNKVKEEGTLHVVFIDMAKNSVLYSERFVAKPGGFGMRNYWAKIIYNVMDKIGDTKYKDWKKSNA